MYSVDRQPSLVTSTELTAATSTASKDGLQHSNHSQSDAVNSQESSSKNNSTVTKPNDAKTSGDRRVGRSPIIYLVCSTVAVGLTVASPETRLWKSDGIDYEVFCELLIIYIIALLSFWIVHGSDPGYLDHDAMERFSELDNYLDGDQETFEENHVKQEANKSNGTIYRRLHKQTSISSHSSEADYTSRSLVDESNVEDEETCPLSTDETHSSSVFDKKLTRRKFCEECGFAPPLRSHHCQICKKCVATFDHHCIFIGTCIGERNHCRFWWFVSTQMIGFIIFGNVLSSSPYGFQSFFSDNDTKYFWVKPLTVILAKAFLYLQTFSTGMLWIVHTFLATTNSTTFEWAKSGIYIDYMKGIEAKDLPFSKRLDENLRVFCCIRDSAIQVMFGFNRKWVPTLWKMKEEKIQYDKLDCWDSPCNNKYYSCC